MADILRDRTNKIGRSPNLIPATKAGYVKQPPQNDYDGVIDYALSQSFEQGVVGAAKKPDEQVSLRAAMKAAAMSPNTPCMGLELGSTPPRWHDQRSDGPACDIMRFEEPTKSTKVADINTTGAVLHQRKRRSSLKRLLSARKPSRGSEKSQSAASSTTCEDSATGDDTALIAADRSQPTRRRSFLRRSLSMNTGKRSKRADPAPVPTLSEVGIKASAVPQQDKGDTPGTVLFGMDVSVPEQLAALHQYFLHLGEENIRLEQAEDELTRESSEIMRENEELKQRLQEAEQQFRRACDQIDGLRTRNNQLETEIESLREELDSPTFL